MMAQHRKKRWWLDVTVRLPLLILLLAAGMMCCGFFFAVGVKDLAVYMAVFADAAGKSAAGADDETETPVAGVKDDDLALHPYKDDDYRNPN